MDDKRIVELYFERNERAINETASKYGNYCYSIAYNILYNNEDAEESVNDTYADAWNSMPPHCPSVLSTFLGKITRRISIDRWRKNHAEKRGGGEMPLVLEELQECVASDNRVELELEKRRLTDIINAFVLSLPKTEQKVFLCRYWYMDSVDSICKQFGFSESKVRSMLYRTREKLRMLLRGEGFD
ncbi:MAG: sigma-70 family RNA polymerase sigma factor [Oscillospiraceae bacterium]|nr:sigma-70 family RNA polymerase sigma factor [Oscillospiraceae bacterium]